ncbi:MAG: alpha/beta fold hydrolase [Anaeromyxobacteraceae bacterium]
MLVAPATKTGAVRLPGGRALAWASWGPDDGAPVVLCPGAATGRSLGLGPADLAGLRARVISFDRPGLGASDPAPGRTLASWAHDVAAASAALGLGRPAVLGFSQGAPFALACAAAGIASACAFVSGTDELAHPEVRARLAPGVRGFVEAIERDRAAAEAFLAGMDAARLRALVLEGSSPGDRAVYAAPDFAREFERALDEGFAQGPAGYVTDTVLASSPWPFDPGAIRVPVQLWYGGRDASPVHAPDGGAHLAARIPGATRHFLPEAGGALPWTHAGELLAALAPHARSPRAPASIGATPSPPARSA